MDATDDFHIPVNKNKTDIYYMPRIQKLRNFRVIQGEVALKKVVDTNEEIVTQTRQIS